MSIVGPSILLVAVVAVILIALLALLVVGVIFLARRGGRQN